MDPARLQLLLIATAFLCVGVTLHRMRRRFGELLREEVARTVNDPGEVDKEIRHAKERLKGTRFHSEKR